MNSEQRLLPLYDVLRALAEKGRISIAFSGGLDSRFLAYTAARIGLEPLLLHVSGPHLAPSEHAWAREWAAAHGLSLLVEEADPLTVPEVAANSTERCYFCKHALFSSILRKLESGQIPGVGSGPFVLCDGTNASDSLSYRPGGRAIQELGIASPLAAAGLSKDQIREFARLTGMDRPEQKARPCLLTRMPYGFRPRRELLARLAEAEQAVICVFLNALMTTDEDSIPDFRLRLQEDERAVLHFVETLPEPLQEQLRSAVASCGLELADVCRVEQLSGYYDRLRETSHSVLSENLLS